LIVGSSPVEADRLPLLAGALRRAAGRFGTPLAITDVAGLATAATELAEAFPDPCLRHFSIKANDVPAIVGRLGDLGLGANVVSLGEWAIARRAGIANDRITLEGIGKTSADLRAVGAAAVRGEPLRWTALESVEEAAELGQVARRAARRGAGRLDVLLRYNPAVEPETTPGLAVGAGSSKFGLADDELAGAIEAGGGPDGSLRWRGIQVHIGSQLGAVDAWRDGVRRALAIVGLLGGSLPDFDTLDLGGGFPVFDLDTPVPRPARFGEELGLLLEGLPADRRPARMAVEPGRFLVARAGFLIARVLHVRRRNGPMVVLDTGLTELIRPALYGARHAVVALTSEGRSWPLGPADSGDLEAAGEEPTAVEGPICESTDSFGLHRLPRLRRGDLVAIRDTGAYGASLGSSYNGRPRPPQVLLEFDGGLTLARPRGGRTIRG
jgi:diaminopimelate decarboxylase